MSTTSHEIFEQVESVDQAREAYQNFLSRFPEDEKSLIAALKAVLTRRCLGDIAEYVQNLLASHCKDGENLDWLCDEFNTASDNWFISVCLTMSYLLENSRISTLLASRIATSDDRDIRSRCLTTLSDGVQYPHVRTAIASISRNHENMHIRNDAVGALAGNIETSETQAMVIAAFSDAEHSIGNNAVNVLCIATPSDSLRELLLAELGSTNSNSRRCAAKALQRWVTTSVIVRKALYNCFGDEDLIGTAAASAFYKAVKDQTIRTEIIQILRCNLESESKRVKAALALEPVRNEVDVRQCYLEVYSSNDCGSILCQNLANFEMYQNADSVLKPLVQRQLLSTSIPDANRAFAARMLSIDLRTDDELFVTFERLSTETMFPELKVMVDQAIELARTRQPRRARDDE